LSNLDFNPPKSKQIALSQNWWLPHRFRFAGNEEDRKMDTTKTPESYDAERNEYDAQRNEHSKEQVAILTKTIKSIYEEMLVGANRQFELASLMGEAFLEIHNAGGMHAIWDAEYEFKMISNRTRDLFITIHRNYFQVQECVCKASELCKRDVQLTDYYDILNGDLFHWAEESLDENGNKGDALDEHGNEVDILEEHRCKVKPLLNKLHKHVLSTDVPMLERLSDDEEPLKTWSLKDKFSKYHPAIYHSTTF